MPTPRGYVPPYLRGAIQREILAALDIERSRAEHKWWFRFRHPGGRHTQQRATIIPFTAWLAWRHPSLLNEGSRRTPGRRTLTTLAWGVGMVLNARGFGFLREGRLRSGRE